MKGVSIDCCVWTNAIMLCIVKGFEIEKMVTPETCDSKIIDISYWLMWLVLKIVCAVILQKFGYMSCNIILPAVKTGLGHFAKHEYPHYAHSFSQGWVVMCPMENVAVWFYEKSQFEFGRSNAEHPVAYM